MSEKVLSWITFSDKIVVSNFDECKCDKCKKEYDRSKKLNWINTFSSFPYFFCDGCYKIVLDKIGEFVE